MSLDREAYGFFREWAGGIVGEDALTAARLARAESLLERACEIGVASVEWVADDEPYDPGDEDPGYVARQFESNAWTGPFGCIVRVFADGAFRCSCGAGDDADIHASSCIDRANLRTGEEIASASLWGIVVGPRGIDDPYCRVVAAELASGVDNGAARVPPRRAAGRADQLERAGRAAVARAAHRDGGRIVLLPKGARTRGFLPVSPMLVREVTS